jgi:16S rRNA processing protein RimM
MSLDPAGRLEVGRIGKPHGIRGDVTVMMVTDRAERTEPGAVLHAGERALVIAMARPVRAGWVIHFEGVDDREAAESLRNQMLFADPIDADDGELWVRDVIGCEVVDSTGRVLGTVTAVEANPAHDLLVLDGSALVPMPFVVEHAPGRIVIDPPDGLFDA